MRYRNHWSVHTADSRDEAPSEDERFNPQLDCEPRFYSLGICSLEDTFMVQLVDQIIRKCLAMAQLPAQRKPEWAAL